MSIDHATGLKALQLYGMATAWSELQAEKPKQAHRLSILVNVNSDSART